MAIEFKLPDIGEGIAEAEIVGWFVSPGDTVEEFQPIVEVMTDKTVVEIPSPAAGTITELRAEVGDTVPVGQVIFVLDGAGDATAAAPAAAQEEKAPAVAAAAAAPAASAPAAGAPSLADTRGGAQKPGRVLAVPSARRVARELGVELAEIHGTGRNGVIRSADVRAYHEAGGRPATPPIVDAPAPSFPPLSIPEGEDQIRTPFRGLRRKIAEAMTRSMHTAAHFTVVEEVDVTDLVALRKKAREMGERDGIKVTYMPFLMTATAKALARFPELNSQLDEDTQEIVTFRRVHLGIATDTDNGLIVPVVRDVQAKGMLQLAHEMNDIVARTRDGKASLEELRGSTFTITNAGNIGGTLATPIINFPEVGILGVHRIVKRPGVVERPDGDHIEVRHYMNLSVSVDHRLTDGANAARFLTEMRSLLENPGLLAL